MSLFILPDEIIDFICEYLDLESKVNFYDTCRRTRQILGSSKFLERCKLTFQRVSIYVLQHDFLTDNKLLVQKLDISGIDYVKRKILVKAIPTFKNLVDLNIGYTQILMPESRDICKKLPKLNKLCTNFAWAKEFTRLEVSELKLYRSAFAHLDCLHFIGSSNIVFESSVVQHMVDQERLRELRLTAINLGGDIVIAAESMPSKFPFKKVTLEVKERLEYPYMPFNIERIQLLSNINVDEWDSLLIKFSHHIFSDMSLCNKMLSEQAESHQHAVFLETPTGFTDDYKIVMWLKDHCSTQLLDKVKCYCESALPTVVTARNSNSLDSINRDGRSYFICSCAAVSENQTVVVSPVKRNRLSRVITNAFDAEKILHNTVECLTLAKMKCACTGGLPPGPIRFVGNLNVFRNLKFLCLTDNAWYDINFLRHLFSNCSRLATLNIQNDRCNYIEVTKYLNISKSLRHFRLCQRTLDINNAFQGIATCPTLEVVVLFDTSTVFSNLPLTRSSIRNLVENCPKLLYLALMSSISEAATKQQRKIFKECMQGQPGFTFLNTPTNINIPRNPYEHIFSDHDYIFPENIY